MLKRIVLVWALVLSVASPSFAGFLEGKAAFVKQDWETAMQELKPLAEKGDDRAMLLVARMHILGKGVPQSLKTALAWYKRAITEKNNTEAMVMVGQMCASQRQALAWFQRATYMGDGTGAFYYASYFANNVKGAKDVVPTDLEAAYKWYKIASLLPASKSRYRGYSENQTKLLAKFKLKPDVVARLDKEAKSWRPVPAASLGPLPAFPEVDDKPKQKAAAAEKNPDEKKIP